MLAQPINRRDVAKFHQRVGEIPGASSKMKIANPSVLMDVESAAV